MLSSLDRRVQRRVKEKEPTEQGVLSQASVGQGIFQIELQWQSRVIKKGQTASVRGHVCLEPT